MHFPCAAYQDGSAGDFLVSLLCWVGWGFLISYLIGLMVLALLLRSMKHPHDEPDWVSLRRRLLTYCAFAVVCSGGLVIATMQQGLLSAIGMGVGAVLAGRLMYWDRRRYARKQLSANSGSWIRRRGLRGLAG